MSQDNYTAIVTGATRGIGHAIGEKLLSHGFSVVFCGSDPERVRIVSEEWQKVYGNRVFGFSADLTVKKDVQEFGRKALDLLGKCTVLVNNAGIFLPGSLLGEEDGVFEKQINLNLGHAYHLSRVVVPEMKGQPRAHVFNICSIASLKAYPDGGSYCISKFALLGLTKVLREELLNSGICVSAILPGATLTDSWKGTELPESRFMRSSDVADALLSAWEINTTTCMEEITLRPLNGDI